MSTVKLLDGLIVSDTKEALVAVTLSYDNIYEVELASAHNATPSVKYIGVDSSKAPEVDCAVDIPLLQRFSRPQGQTGEGILRRLGEHFQETHAGLMTCIRKSDVAKQVAF